MANKQQSGHQGEVKDPAHDGRLKGHHGGEAKAAHESGRHNDQKQQEQQSKGGSHAGSHAASGKNAGSQTQNESRSQGGSDDLKAREYRDADGNVHHHTKSYMEQHKGE